MSDAIRLLEERASSAGLSWPLRPWPRTGDVRERLAANPFLMAPMAGVSDRAWRLMARAGGAACAVSEMVSAAGLHYGSEKTWDLVRPDPAEDALAVQLFGSDPHLFEEAAERVAERLGAKLLFLDVNMACPVPKVVRKGEGVALMDDPLRAHRIIAACRRGLDRAGLPVPVTAKIRLGRSPYAPSAADVAHAIALAGAAAVSIHGRYGSQGYAGASDDEAVREVARGSSLPVLASGDVRSAERCVELARCPDLAGVLVARGSYGNPWIFSDALRLLHGERVPVHGVDERLGALELHLRLLGLTGEHVLKGRQIACHYVRGLPGAAASRRWIMAAVTLDDFLEVIETLRCRAASAEDPGQIEAEGSWSL